MEAAGWIMTGKVALRDGGQFHPPGDLIKEVQNYLEVLLANIDIFNLA